MSMKILLIEDEVKTAQSLKSGLEENHFEVDKVIINLNKFNFILIFLLY